MLGTFLPKENPSLPLRVEADENASSASSEHAASRRSARLLFAGLGSAVLLLMVVSTRAFGSLASQAAAKSSHLVQEVAFNPYPVEALLPGRAWGTIPSRARPTAWRPAALPRLAQRNRRQPFSVVRMSDPVDDEVPSDGSVTIEELNFQAYKRVKPDSTAETTETATDDMASGPAKLDLGLNYMQDEAGLFSGPLDEPSGEVWDSPGVMPDWTEWNSVEKATTAPPSNADSTNHLPHDHASSSLMPRVYLKNDLLRKTAVCDRGYGATMGEREIIEGLVRQMADINPTENAATGIEGFGSASPLRGAWRLIYTSATDVLALAANPVSNIGGVYQDIQDGGIITNIIDVLNPRALSILPPSAQIDSTLRLEVQTRARQIGPSRVGLNFEKVTISPQKFFGNDVSFLPKPTIDLPRIPGTEGDDTPGYFDIDYVDNDMLIIRQNQPGGIFILVKVDPALEPVPF